MALLKLILDLKRLHHWSINVWHGDHGWHDQSDCIAKELQCWCAENSLNYFSDCTTKEKTKSEAAARNWRYEQLAKTAKMLSSKDEANPCTHILTGHTGSDRAETLLLNLSRGSDITGISSLEESRILHTSIHLVRPLLGFNRGETALICKEMKLPIWVDPSNTNISLSRNKVREQVIPILEDLHPGCSMRMASLAERLSHYREDQHAIVDLLLQAIKHSDEGLDLCRTTLSKLPTTARTTVLARWLKQKGVPVLSAAQLEELSFKIGKNKAPGCTHLANKWKISWLSESIRLEHSC